VPCPPDGDAVLPLPPVCGMAMLEIHLAGTMTYAVDAAPPENTVPTGKARLLAIITIREIAPPYVPTPQAPPRFENYSGTPGGLVGSVRATPIRPIEPAAAAE
jgi:hypothetical protein